MDKQHIKGALKDAEGKVKEQAGKILNNKELEAEGAKDQAEGKTRKVTGDVKDAASR